MEESKTYVRGRSWAEKGREKDSIVLFRMSSVRSDN